jgi:hypothetical protein
MSSVRLYVAWCFADGIIKSHGSGGTRTIMQAQFRGDKRLLRDMCSKRGDEGYHGSGFDHERASAENIFELNKSMIGGTGACAHQWGGDEKAVGRGRAAKDDCGGNKPRQNTRKQGPLPWPRH